MAEPPSAGGAEPALAHWDDRRVFVTGHSGFVGSWLCTMLRRLGARVVGFANNADPASQARDRWLRELGVTSVVGDVRDFEAVHRVLAGGSFDAVIHLAAQPLVSVGYQRPRETLETNLSGSINLLEAARLTEPGVLLHITSDKCYRNQGWPWPYREVDPLGGGCPYSVSKAAAELIFEAYAKLFAAGGGMPAAASVRFGNIIGGGDVAANRLVPDCLTALREGRPIALRRPDAVRPWQHVLDVVYGLLLLADALAAGRVAGGEVFNFAPPTDGATVARLASALIEAWGAGELVRMPSEGFVEDEVLRLDGRQAAAAVGWRHRFDLEGAANWVVSWQRAVLAGVAPGPATVEQVEGFLADRAPAREVVARDR